MDTENFKTARLRSGQALIELAIGLLSLFLIVSSLVVFAVYIVQSLENQNNNRGRATILNENPLTGVATLQ